MKLKLIIAYLILSATLVAAAKDSLPKSKHSIFIEIGGNAPIYSFNYEFQLVELKNSTIVQSIGFEIPRFDSPRNYFVNGQTINQRRLSLAFFPLRCSWVSHKSGKSHFELGLGATYYTASLPTNSVDMLKEIKLDSRGQGIFLIPNLGYRYTPKSGLLIRVSITPYFSRTVNPNIQLYGGVSFGYHFKSKKYENK